MLQELLDIPNINAFVTMVAEVVVVVVVVVVFVVLSMILSCVNSFELEDNNMALFISSKCGMGGGGTTMY